LYDVIVVGGGPAGLTAAANTSHRGLKSLVIEKQDFTGGLPVLLYPDKIIRDHPGFPCGIIGKELSRMLSLQAENAGVEFKRGEEVLKIDRKEDALLEVRTPNDVYQSRRVILCTGIYNVPKKLPLLDGYTGPNLHYGIKDPQEYARRKVVIVGGGDHAFDIAIQLSKISDKVTVLVIEKYAKAKESSVRLAEASGVNVCYDTEIINFFKDRSGVFHRIQIIDHKTEEKTVLDVDELFVAIGFETVKTFLENNGFQLRGDGSLVVDDNSQTSIEGVFAAGDIAGEIRLIATACSGGIVTAIHAFEEIQKPYWLK
jgi:thioredoxin reductase (NADPH)